MSGEGESKTLVGAPKEGLEAAAGQADVGAQGDQGYDNSLKRFTVDNHFKPLMSQNPTSYDAPSGGQEESYNNNVFQNETDSDEEKEKTRKPNPSDIASESEPEKENNNFLSDNSLLKKSFRSKLDKQPGVNDVLQNVRTVLFFLCFSFCVILVLIAFSINAVILSAVFVKSFYFLPECPAPFVWIPNRFRFETEPNLKIQRTMDPLTNLGLSQNTTLQFDFFVFYSFYKNWLIQLRMNFCNNQICWW